MAATTEPTSETRNVGRIEEIQGVVIEAVFPDELPEIYSAITVAHDASPEEPGANLLVLEVQHAGSDASGHRFRAIGLLRVETWR